MTPCPECYSDRPRITPLLNPRACLERHEQYVCGTCGRCICIAKDPVRGLQRWQFPFKSAPIALLYLRAAEASTRRSCGVYGLRSESGRASFKIFPGRDALEAYLARNPGKACIGRVANAAREGYRAFPDAQVRMLAADEVERYLAEQAAASGSR
ncbi:hypothetical protein C1878_07810 [Gordonibacter sp. 28C]|uniref:hypothetical protein n=1 Tax=Gordonibacter sp. 28C TaxID=2078569 RepID=UPI000DF753E4|nr:hypothetical protein [Gordonibacter sp. 28C]RDB62232.1 hypothetical protein C1878_07810 [Gordonibacter sp. 28C]